MGGATPRSSRSEGPDSRRARGDLEIHAVSAWILRAGVLSSVATMTLGLALSLHRAHPDVARMMSDRLNPDLARLLRGSLAGDGASLMGLGVLLLVLTPILRVASSMAIFVFEERDWLYSAVTLLVLAMTLLSLLALS